MSDRLRGKVAVVTGAGRGIGKAEALGLASEGAKVVVNDLGAAADGTGASKFPADSTVTEIRGMGGEAVANYDSVAAMQGAKNMIAAAVAAFGRLDILVNNAGIMHDNDVFNMTEDEWDIVIRTHLYGHFFAIRHACALFRQQRTGRIINTSSSAGLGLTMGELKYVNYSAAKEGIVGLTRRVAVEMGAYGVTCNAIRPAAGTRLTINDEIETAYRKAGRTTSARQRWEQMKPEDVAPLVVWLASDDAANVNGRTFFISTGKVALYSEPIEERAVFKVGGWTTDDFFRLMPLTLANGLTNLWQPSTESCAP